MVTTLQQKQDIAKRAVKIIVSNEGNYGSVNKNDNGAVSIGMMQWHGNRALSLLQMIGRGNVSLAEQYLGSPLWTEVNSSTNWGNRIVNQVEAQQISNFISTPQGKAAQDELAVTDVLSYVNKGIKYGLSDEYALIYFCDGVNQYGTNSSLWKTIATEALKKGGTLDAMFEATKNATKNYLSRRESVYKKLKAEQNAAGGGTASTPTPVPSNEYKIKPQPKEVKDIQTWLNLYCDAKLVVDGSAGPKTKRAFAKAIQHFTNELYKSDPKYTPLVEDGLIGPKTSKVCPYLAIDHNNHTPLAYIVKAMLYINGYNPNGLDTDYDEDAKKAMIQFQKDHGFQSPGGKPGLQTFIKLLA